MQYMPASITKIWAGLKTQTRRPTDPGDELEFIEWEEDRPILVVRRKGRIFLRVGQDYAACPGRGKAQVGRILLRKIRVEPIGQISDADAIAEGVEKRVTMIVEGAMRTEYVATFRGEEFVGETAAEAFLMGWRKLYPRMGMDETVYALDIEPFGGLHAAP